jgi:hypothetical protein
LDIRHEDLGKELAATMQYQAATLKEFEIWLDANAPFDENSRARSAI